MSLKRVSPSEAQELAGQGYTLLDVRSTPEFDSAHCTGAYNVPYLHKTDHGMVPNAEFSEVVQDVFPDKAQKILTYCKMGGRSARAAQELMALGYSDVVDMQGGFLGEVDPGGEVVNAGWSQEDLPIEHGATGGRAYAHLKKDKPPEPAEAEAAPAQGGGNAADRFAHPTRTVQCVKLSKALPALKRTPMGGPLGTKIRENVSAEGWNLWVEHSKMLINEYRLNASEPKAQEMLLKQCEEFFFGDGGQAPAEFVPPSE